MIRLMILILLCCAHPAVATPLDLQSWESAGSFKLTSGWEFFWQTWVTPGTPSVQGLPLDHELCWHKIVNPLDQKPFPAAGYGSYKISFRGLSPRKDGYEIFLRSAATAYQAYLYADDDADSLVTFSNGQIGSTPDTSIPQSYPLTVSFHPTSADQVWTLILQVSNFHHVRSGLWQPPEIARGEYLSTKNRREREGYIFSIATVLIIGIYSFMIFVRRRGDYSSLSLCLFCLVVAIRAFSTSDLLSYLFPFVTIEVHNLKYLIEYTSLILGPISYGAFVHFSFDKTTKSSLLNFQIGISVTICLFILATPPAFFTRFILLYQSIGMFIVVEYLYFLARATYLKSEGAALAFTGTSVLSVALIYDILIQHGVLHPPFISQYGVGAFVFLQSQVVASRFAKAFNTAERLSHDLQLEVEKQTANIRSLMNHVPLGIFTIDDNLTIGKAYSAQLEEIFSQRQLEGRPVLDVMFNDTELTIEQISIVRSSLVAAWGEPIDLWGLNESQLPTEYRRKDQTLEADWHPVGDKDHNIVSILVTIRNVTQLRQFKNQAERRELDIQLLTEMIQVDSKHFHRFWREAESLLRPLILDAATIPAVQIARDLHSLKGLARSLGLRQLTSVIHNSESLLLAPLPQTEQKELVEKIGTLFQVYQELYQQRLAPRESVPNAQLIDRENLVRVQREWRRGPGLETQEGLREAVKSLLCNSVFRSMDDLSRELHAEGTRLAQQLDKSPFKLHHAGPVFFLNEDVESLLRHAFLHLLRNAMDHGFLPSGDRNDVATIDLRWNFDDSLITYVWADNGRGLNMKGLWKKCGRASEPLPTDHHKRWELANSIFDDGISTANALSEVSGRGIGMSAARSMFESLGGSLHIQLLAPFDLDQQKFKFILRLPRAQAIEV